MDLSVIIVSFNTNDRLRECLRSVFASATRFSYEVLVVDNASTDGTVQMMNEEFPAAKLIVNAENFGYSRANNQALRAASGRYYLLLNPDVEIQSDSFDKMISFMDNDKSIGISGPRVVKTDGSFDKASRRSFPNLKNSLLHFVGLPSDYNLNLPYDKNAEIDSVMGAFLMIRAEAVEKIGLLDEAFFMYGEDLDWCWRVKEYGYKVVYAPVTTVVHHKGSSSRRLPGKALYEFHRSMFVFYEKHYAAKHNFFINYLVKMGIWTRYVMKSFINFVRTDKYVSR